MNDGNQGQDALNVSVLSKSLIKGTFNRQKISEALRQNLMKSLVTLCIQAVHKQKAPKERRTRR